jgi:hypothetical protein
MNSVFKIRGAMNEIAERESVQDLRITAMYNLLVQKFTLHGIRNYFSLHFFKYSSYLNISGRGYGYILSRVLVTIDGVWIGE